MTSFDDRETAFESKFAHDADMQFRAEARRNKLAGLWAAGLLGKSGDEAQAYAMEVVNADFEEAGIEDVVRKLVIHGTPERVVDQLHALREETGDFGTLLYAGVDWTDRTLARDSMVLMAEKVLPRMND